MSCHPEEVTAFVDGQLPDAARARIAAHLTAPCPRCVAQAEEERAVRRLLHRESAGVLGLEARVRAALDCAHAASGSDDSGPFALPARSNTLLFHRERTA